MRFLFVATFLLLASAAVQAQTDSTIQADTTQPVVVAPAPARTTVNTGTQPRSNDHFMLQVGYTGWQGAPDTVSTSGIGRSFNAYFMLDLPFKTSPHWSAAIGVGISTDNVYFDKRTVDITGTTSNVVFRNLSDTTHFKRYKLATAYAEAPIELRYSSNPDDSRRSVKAAIGVKVGTLLNAHTKGKTLQSSTGGTLNDYKEKLFDKRYFNKQRVSATARLGYGHFTLFAAYQLTPLFREGVAATIRPYTVGLTLSGL